MSACCKYLRTIGTSKLLVSTLKAKSTSLQQHASSDPLLRSSFHTAASTNRVMRPGSMMHTITVARVAEGTPRSYILQVPQMSWSMCRTYAKKGKEKGGKGAKGGKANKKMTLDSEQLDGVVDLDKVRGDFERVLEDLREKFIHQLTVRTSQGVFDSLEVKTPDGNFPLIQLGQVVQKSPQLMTINMAASPQYITQVKQALATSGLNVNPQQDGTSLFIPLPKVTREHRENLAKNAKMVAEQSKKSLREIYSKYARKIKASKGGHSSDDLVAADEMVKDMMHANITHIEEMTASKQKELLGAK